VFEGDVRSLRRPEPGPWYCTARCAADPGGVLRVVGPVVPVGSVLAVSAPPDDSPAMESQDDWCGPVFVEVSGWRYLRWSRRG
jgi:hypothetical protein